MLILNFGLAITQIQLDRIEELANRQVEQIIRIKVKIAPYEPLEPQVVDIIDCPELTVLIGGPPHAGKSVLFYSLTHALR